MSCPSTGSGRHDRAGHPIQHPIQHPIYSTDGAGFGGSGQTGSSLFVRVGRSSRSSHGRGRGFKSLIAHQQNPRS